MKLKLKKEDIFPFIVIALCGPLLVFVLIAGGLTQSSISRNGEITYAIITEFRTGPRLSHSLTYEYFVDGVRHQGNGVHRPNSDNFSIGDSIAIIFDTTRPANSRLKRHRAFLFWQTTPFIHPADNTRMQRPIIPQLEN